MFRLFYRFAGTADSQPIRTDMTGQTKGKFITHNIHSRKAFFNLSHPFCRGMKKARKVMIDAMKHELETNFREEYEAGNVYLMAASSSTDEVTAEWMAQIKESFPGMDVMCDKYQVFLY